LFRQVHLIHLKALTQSIIWSLLVVAAEDLTVVAVAVAVVSAQEQVTQSVPVHLIR
jgi:hypothetical protein